MKKLLFLLLITAIVIVTGSPLFNAYQLKNAYDEHDGTTIASSIDYPKLTHSLKIQLTTGLTNTISQYPMVAKLGGDNLLTFGNNFINHAVDGAITAENIEVTVRTEGQQANIETKQLAAAWAIASNNIDLKKLTQDMLIQRGDMEAVIKQQVENLTHNNEQQLSGQQQSGTDGEPSFAYCGLNCFEIQGVVKGYPLTIQMERDGIIQWKIVDVKLP